MNTTSSIKLDLLRSTSKLRSLATTHGNIDARRLPSHAMHIKYEDAQNAANSLDVCWFPALVGFEEKDNGAKTAGGYPKKGFRTWYEPVIQGIVVQLEDAPIVLQKLVETQQHEQTK